MVRACRYYLRGLFCVGLLVMIIYDIPMETTPLTKNIWVAVYVLCVYDVALHHAVKYKLPDAMAIPFVRWMVLSSLFCWPNVPCVDKVQ